MRCGADQTKLLINIKTYPACKVPLDFYVLYTIQKVKTNFTRNQCCGSRSVKGSKLIFLVWIRIRSDPKLCLQKLKKVKKNIEAGKCFWFKVCKMFVYVSIRFRRTKIQFLQCFMSKISGPNPGPYYLMVVEKNNLQKD